MFAQVRGLFWWVSGGVPGRESGLRWRGAARVSPRGGGGPSGCSALTVLPRGARGADGGVSPGAVWHGAERRAAGGAPAAPLCDLGRDAAAAGRAAPLPSGLPRAPRRAPGGPPTTTRHPPAPPTARPRGALGRSPAGPAAGVRAGGCGGQVSCCSSGTTWAQVVRRWLGRAPGVVPPALHGGVADAEGGGQAFCGVVGVCGQVGICVGVAQCAGRVVGACAAAGSGRHPGGTGRPLPLPFPGIPVLLPAPQAPAS